MNSESLEHIIASYNPQLKGLENGRKLIDILLKLKTIKESSWHQAEIRSVHRGNMLRDLQRSEIRYYKDGI